MANPDIMEAVDEIKAIKASVAAEFADEYSGRRIDRSRCSVLTAQLAPSGGRLGHSKHRR